jgi:TRAP-type C4-dicarboxylate transport system permease small subunit|tara:strand:+ start:4163 stop:4678 length:516 start_codon:yes stop_codon:yes gene_type:complete
VLRAALAFLSKTNEWLEKAIYLLAIFLVANMVLALFLSALIRYVSGTGYDWFIELPPILTSWLVFPLLGPLLKSGSHIKVDVITTILTSRQLSWLRLLIAVIALLASIVFLVAGIEATSLYLMLGQVMELEIEIPIWWVYLAFPTGFGILALFALELILFELVALYDLGRS